MLSHLKGRTCTRVRLLVLGVVAATLMATAPAAAAQTVRPTLGRWAGSGKGGSVGFVVAPDHGTLVVYDLVVSCGAAYGADDSFDPYDTAPIPPPAAVEPDGRLLSLATDVTNRPFRPVIAGRLGHARGTVSVSSTEADTGRCPSDSFHDVHVAPTHAPVLRDGAYTVTEAEPGDHGEFYIAGEGALIQWSALFATPVGGDEDDPALCAEALAQTSSVSNQAGEPDVSVLFNRTGAFSAHTFYENPAELDAASFSITFTSSQTASGSYSATYEFEDNVACTGAGPFALTLSQPSPPLAPVEPPPRGQRPAPGRTNPGDAHKCAMLFQIQQKRATPYSRPVHSPHPIM